MKDFEIKEMLDKQLQLLAEQSMDSRHSLPELSHAMCEVLSVRAAFDVQQGTSQEGTRCES